MAKRTKATKTPEYDALVDCRAHWEEAKSELDTRITHKEQGFDEYDRLYRSYIERGKWPFNSRIFIPATFTSIFSKGTRLVTGKVKGRLVAGPNGDELKAQIGTELLSAQYDDHDFHFEEPLVSKWLRMDQNARKYGASFGLVSWRRETDDSGKVVFDGPTFEVLDNRKTYLQPGATSVTDSDYVIVEREVTVDQLERINDRAMARTGKDAYMNLEKVKQAGATHRSDHNQSVNSTLRSLDGKSGGTGKFKKVRMLTEYRRDKWISWFPDIGDDKDSPLGLLARVIDNPYRKAGITIPVIRLVYIPIDDDIYGVSEIEPGRSQQKAMNALTSGFIEAVSTELYPIIKGHPTNVDWKTIEFKPRAAWIMNNPQTDVARLEGGVTFTRNFVEAFRLLDSKFAQSMGDTAGEGSQLATMAGGDKTATEIKDLALQRGSRDNLNKVFLSSAITKMYSMWWALDQQLLPDKKVISVAGKDALRYFVEQGLDQWTLSDEGYEAIANYLMEYPTIEDPETGVSMQVDYQLAYEMLREAGELEQFARPMFPIMQQGQQLPKLRMSNDGKRGSLTVEKSDTAGEYRYSIDLNTLGTPSPNEEMQNLLGWLDRVEKLAPAMQQEGYTVKFKEILEALAEKGQIRNADQYFEQMTEQDQMAQQMQMQGGQPSMMPPTPENGIPQVNGVTPEQLMSQLPQANGQGPIQQPAG